MLVGSWFYTLRLMKSSSTTTSLVYLPFPTPYVGATLLYEHGTSLESIEYTQLMPLG